MTLTEGHAALHQSLVGDRLRLCLDADLSASVTGHERPLAHPNLVCDVAIGQSTGPSQRVLGNLFYRGLVLQRPVFVGDTLRTRTAIVAMKQNRPRPDGAATGLVALRVQTSNQDGEPVLDFWRCPMIPLRDPSAETGHADGFAEIPAELDMERVREAVPAGWRYGLLREAVAGDPGAEIFPGGVYEIDGRDTVTSAPELARLTLNIAKAHTDAGSAPAGRRLVYGGFTISIAAAQLTRALPGMATVIAWHGCDHLGPVFEDDVLATELTVEALRELDDADASLAELRAVVHADREGAEGPEAVLDWRLVALVV